MSDRSDVHDELSPDDARFLDALVDSGFDPEALGELSTEERRRVDALTGLFGLMRDYPVDDADETLIHATLARIDRHEDTRAARMTFDVEQDGVAQRRRIRIPDFISVAAVLLIVASIAWPLMREVRNRSIDAGCANNLRLVGYGFSNYAADNDGLMPVARAGLGGSWDTIANVLNLAPLVEGGYCESGHLSCPGGHGMTQDGYSYRWQPPDAPLGWDTRVTLVLGDRNPLIEPARHGRYEAPLSASLNHGGRGQYVLSSDGATLWLVQPLIRGDDNIWLPSGSAFLLRGVQPKEPGDVFLAH